MNRQTAWEASLHRGQWIHLASDQRNTHASTCSTSFFSLSHWLVFKGVLEPSVQFAMSQVGFSSGMPSEVTALNTEKLEETSVFISMLFIIAIMLESKFPMAGKWSCKSCSGHSVGNYIAFKIVFTKGLLQKSKTSDVVSKNDTKLCIKYDHNLVFLKTENGDFRFC